MLPQTTALRTIKQVWREPLTLLLLMLGVLADHHDAALALDDLALFTNGLY